MAIETVRQFWQQAQQDARLQQKLSAIPEKQRPLKPKHSIGKIAFRKPTKTLF